MVFTLSYCLQLYKVPEVGPNVALIRKMLPKWFLSHIICAGRPGESDGACHGDSGGPLTQFTESPSPRYQQVGNTTEHGSETDLSFLTLSPRGITFYKIFTYSI